MRSHRTSIRPSAPQPFGSLGPSTIPARPCTSCAFAAIVLFGEWASAVSAASAMARAVGSLMGGSGWVASASTWATKVDDGVPTVIV